MARSDGPPPCMKMPRRSVGFWIPALPFASRRAFQTNLFILEVVS
jgi:hypothetical protein